MKIKDRLLKYISNELKEILINIDDTYFDEVEEIKIRLGKCIIFKSSSKEYFLNNKHNLIKKIEQEKLYIPTVDIINKTIEVMTGYSVYAFENEIKNGFITLKGGFRVGITGKILDGQTIKNISSINIRIPREITGVSNEILKYIYDEKLYSTIIISPPNCGKTTLLRDIIKTISYDGQTVGVVDERSEIGASYMGICQLDVGIRTDILDRCDKQVGILMLLRSMSPNVIAVDEIGTKKDMEAIKKASFSGVQVICTMHAENIEEFKQKQIFEEKIFKRYIILSRINSCKKSRVSKIYDENLNIIYKNCGEICT